MRFSIVMPVYNASKYLNESIESVINQSFKDFELICVDDGSTDNSLEILSNFAKKDTRIKVLSQRNSYAGAARNRGLEEAKGEYLLFLDSDDYYSRKTLSILEKKTRKKPDVVIFGNNVFEDGTKVIPKPNKYKKMGLCLSENIAGQIFQVINTCPWDKCVRRDFIIGHNIRFQLDLKNSEDVLFSSLVMMEANKLLFIPNRLIYYRINNSNSIDGKKGINGPTDFLKSRKAVYDEMKKRNLLSEYYESFCVRTLEVIIARLQNVSSKNELYSIFNYIVKNKYLDYIGISKNMEIINRHIYKNSLLCLYEDDVNIFLIQLLIDCGKNMVSKNKIEYRIGDYILKKFRLK